VRLIDRRNVRTEVGSWTEVTLAKSADGYAICEDGRAIITLRDDAGLADGDSPEANARFAFDVLTARLPKPGPTTPFPWTMTKSDFGFAIEAEGPDGVVSVGHSRDMFVARSVVALSATLAESPEWSRSDTPALMRA